MQWEINHFLGKDISSGYENICFMPNATKHISELDGIVMTLTDRICPHYLGDDLGCGVIAYKVKPKKLDIENLDRCLHDNILQGVSVNISPYKNQLEFLTSGLSFYYRINEDKVLRTFGTLGSKNHFVEIGKGQDNCRWLFVHAGSGLIGQEFYKYYCNKAEIACDGTTCVGESFLSGLEMEQLLLDAAIVSLS